MLYCINTGMLVPNPARHCGRKEERKTLLHTRTARITISLLDAVDSQASELRRELLALASRIRYYDTLPNEIVTIKQGDDVILYQGKIRASKFAPSGPCTGRASNKGDHPYTCDACDALVHGKTSTLNRKLHRTKKLETHKMTLLEPPNQVLQVS